MVCGADAVTEDSENNLSDGVVGPDNNNDSRICDGRLFAPP
jgi:hypothetical protein